MNEQERNHLAQLKQKYGLQPIIDALAAAEAPETGTGAPGPRKHCSFCGKPDSRVNIITGAGVSICVECVGLCNQIITQGKPSNHPRP